jgi:hypothetical protein
MKYADSRQKAARRLLKIANVTAQRNTVPASRTGHRTRLALASRIRDLRQVHAGRRRAVRPKEPHVPKRATS